MCMSRIRRILLTLLLGSAVAASTACIALPIAGQGSESVKVTVTIDGQTFLAGVGDVIGVGEKMENGLCDIPPHTVSAGKRGPGSISVAVGTDAECRLVVRSIKYADSIEQPPAPEGGESQKAEPAEGN